MCNDSTSPSPISSPSYCSAREMGYDLSKEQFSEFYEYARKVQKECINESKELYVSVKVVKPMSFSNSRNNLNSSISYPEDLWIQYLREYFDSELKG